MAYAEEKMREQLELELTRRDGSMFTIQTKEKIQYKSDYYGIVTQTFLPEETKKIAEQFPSFDVCMMVYEDNEEKEYWLYIRFTQEIRLRYHWEKNSDELTLHCDADPAANVFEHNLELDRILTFFKQLVEELPEYRLRIVTGELKLDDMT